MSEAILIAIIALVGSIVNGFLHYRANRAKRLGNNPHPCKDHSDQLRALDEKLDKACERISRIEGKLNGMR